MKYSILLLTILANTAFAADVQVQGYIRNDGTYVQPHYRSAPDNNPYNNYSSQGNSSPYAGQSGNVNPYQQQPSYQAPNNHSYGRPAPQGKSIYSN